MRLLSLLFISLHCIIFAQNTPFQSEWMSQHVQLFDTIGVKLAPLLSVHFSQHEVDEAYLARTMDRYIELLDPDKTYFLASEVDVFIMEKKRAMLYWNNKSLEPFWQLFWLKQAAVVRAQSMRKAIGSFLEKKGKEAAEHMNRDLMFLGFAQDDEDLFCRQTALFLSSLFSPSSSWSVRVERAALQLSLREEKWTLDCKDFFSSCAFFETFLLKAMALALDPHSEIVDDKEASRTKKTLTKTAYGTGIEVKKENEELRIVGIAPSSPGATSKKISVGDRLLAIDSVPVKEMSFSSVLRRLAEKDESEVVSLVLEKKGVSIETTVKKKQYFVDEGRLSWRIVDEAVHPILIMTIECFYKGPYGATASNDMLDAWREANAQCKIQGLIIDLRANRGGFLLESVKMAGLFIKSGVVVVAEYADGSRRFFRDTDRAVEISCPTVVLTSRYTASAAEVLAQALKEYGVALIVGDEQTYGKGTLQMQTMTRQNEIDKELKYKVTVGELFGVAGDALQAKGVRADIVVPGPYSKDQESEKKLAGSLSESEAIAPSFQDPLSDISRASLSWYRKYYIPFLQEPTYELQKQIPSLRRKSMERREKNSFWKKYMKGELQGFEQLEKAQLEEAVLIAKDMSK